MHIDTLEVIVQKVFLKWTYIQKCLEAIIIKDKIWADGVLGEISLTDF